MTQAVILAGGYGTRMRPLTERRPKHVLPLGDSALIEHQLRSLAQASITDVALATAYHADAFRPLLGNGRAYGVALHYAREDSPLGTGGALAYALRSLGTSPEATDPVLVLNGDLITEHNIAAQIASHREAVAQHPQTQVTLHVRHVDDARPYGLITVDGDRAESFQEKPANLVGGFINAGTYVVQPQVVASVVTDHPTSLERDVFPAAAAAGQVRVYCEDAHFADIGSPQALLQANLRWAQARGLDAVVLGAAVADNADVTGSLILSGARVEDGAVVHGCVIGPGAHIGAGAHLTNCVLGDDARVSPASRLHDVTLDVDEVR